VGCSSTPPVVSPSIIKNLGASFYGINPEDLTEEKLSKHPKGKEAKKVIKRKAGSKGSGPSSSKSGPSAPQ
jgi:hypothetical protein